MGIKTRNNALWAQSSIHRILRNPTYIGKVWYGKRKTNPITGKLVAQNKDTWTIAEGVHEAIISDEIFDKVQFLLGQNVGKPTKAKHSYLLAGLIRCGLCGGALSGHSFTKKGSDKTYSYYKCVNRRQKGTVACKGLSLPARKAEDFIIGHLKEMSENTTFLSDKQKMLHITKEKEWSNALNK